MSVRMIEVQNFRKNFGTKEVHRGVTFEVFQGECLGLIGGSGTGKSVLLRSLIGLEKADAGSIRIKGQEITKMRERDLIPIRKMVAYAFQGGALFDSMTVYENLAYPLREHTPLSEPQIHDKILNLLSEFGLQNAENLFPSNLSGGMQKRVGLARAIIMEPELVLYDEPTAGLDPFNTKKISEMILRLKDKKKTGILVTHDMPVAFQVCDRIAMLVDGRLDVIGRPEDIQKDRHHPISIFASGEIS